jgi:hypothetical protein
MTESQLAEIEAHHVAIQVQSHLPQGLDAGWLSNTLTEVIAALREARADSDALRGQIRRYQKLVSEAHGKWAELLEVLEPKP